MKQKAFDFAMEVVGDVNRMAEAFGKGASPDGLMVESWEDLKKMRYVCLYFGNCLMNVRAGMQRHRK
jgi:hypothetical protein